MISETLKTLSIYNNNKSKLRVKFKLSYNNGQTTVIEFRTRTELDRNKPRICIFLLSRDTAEPARNVETEVFLERAFLSGVLSAQAAR